MTATGYCTRCGARRDAGDRFCSKCGLDFWQSAAARIEPPLPLPGAVNTSQAVDGQSSTTVVPLLAGLCWLAAAALTAYLAFLQLQYSALTDGRLADEARNLAIGNGLSAAVTVYFAAKLLLGADRRFLLNSVFWGVLVVIWGVVQIGQGVTADVFLMATVAAGVAGVLSLVAVWQRPPEPRR